MKSILKKIEGGVIGINLQYTEWSEVITALKSRRNKLRKTIREGCPQCNLFLRMDLAEAESALTKVKACTDGFCRALMEKLGE